MGWAEARGQAGGHQQCQQGEGGGQGVGALHRTGQDVRQVSEFGVRHGLAGRRVEQAFNRVQGIGVERTHRQIEDGAAAGGSDRLADEAHEHRG